MPIPFVYLLNRHIFSVSLSRLDLLASLLDGGEDGLEWQGVVNCGDLGGLVLERDFVLFNA
jgi:hypothetical protein